MLKEESFRSEEENRDKNQSLVRQSNIELLRILAMILIIMHHYVIHGTTNFVELPFSVQNVLALFLGAFGRPAMVIFVLICGYFSIKNDFKLPRIVTLIAQVLFYSVFFLLLAIFVLPMNLTIGRHEILKAIFPTAYGSYWFFYIIFGTILLSPFINKLLFEPDTKTT
jgi:surface polysaccharide O-acyltransferase-like enzyme